MSNIVEAKKSNLPASIAALFAPVVANSDLISGGGGFPALSIKGKVWTVVRGKDDREPLLNDDGDPRASIEVVLVKANPHLSKVFYLKKFTEGSDAKPDCYSNDGITPAKDSTTPQAKSCAACPHNEWGSRIGDDGQKGKACSDSKRVAVVPAGTLNDPMLLRVPAASLKPLTEYAKALEKRGVPYQAVVTKIGFDHTVSSPKLTFKAERFLSADEAPQVLETMKEDIIEDILGVSTASESEYTEPAAPAEAPAEAPAKPAKAAKQAVQESDVDDALGGLEEAPAAPAKPAAKKAAVAAEEVEDVLGGLDTAPAEAPAKPAAKKAAKAAPAVQANDLDEMDALLSGLDDA